MEFGNNLLCYSGIDRFSVLTKTEKWLAEYRHYKIKYLAQGLFINKDYSVLLSQIPKKDIKRIKEIQKRIPLINFTSKRIQFLNEKKVLKKLLAETMISYRKLRDIHSVCQKYSLKTDRNEFNYSVSSLKNLIWWSIGHFTYEGTGQEKIASRLYRNRVFINRKLKNCPYIDVVNRHIEIKTFAKSTRKGDLAAQNNTALLKRLKSHPEYSKGLVLKKIKKDNGTEYVALIKVLPNRYETNNKIKNLISIDSKKTFNFTKKSSNSLHFKNLNERSKRVHAKFAFKAFNEGEDQRKREEQKRSWNTSKRKFLKRIIVGSDECVQEYEYVIRPNKSLFRNLKLVSLINTEERWLVHETAS